MPASPLPMFTALHRALGVEPCALDWSLVEQAVHAGVVEQTDLDWKRERHDTKPDWHEEFAKDVAAMANSGGGLIVFGVNEDRATAAAQGFTGSVELRDADERKLRSAIYSRVFPPVGGVVFARLTGDDHAVVVLSVPTSPDAPHLIERQQVFGAPFRDGTRTEWMRERQLAAAYRQRFADAAAVEGRLAALYDEVTVATYADQRVCFVAAAVPETPRPTILGRLVGEDARPIFAAALTLRSQLCSPGISPIKDARGDLSAPRQALRRQTARYDSEDGNAKHRSGFGSVHDDGSTSLAWSIGGMLQRETAEPGQLSARYVEAAVADFVALTGAASRALRMSTPYELQVGLAWSGEPPIVIRRPDSSLGGYDLDPESSIPIKRFAPARTTLAPAANDEELLHAARDLALDCVSQAGIAHLTHLLDR